MKKFHPFRSFQRNKTGWMAGLTLLAIVSFLFLPVILDLVGGGGGIEGRVTTYAESRRFGKVNDFDLHRFQQDHEHLYRFLHALRENLLRAAFSDMELEQMTVEEHQAAFHTQRMLLLPLEQFLGQVEQLRHPEQLIDFWLVTQYAGEEGYTPEREDIQNLLRQLTSNTISTAIYRDSLSAVGISEHTMERLLIQQILWERARQRFIQSISAVTPATQWEWFQRVRREITVEAAAVPVESLLSQVGEPSDRVLNAFFEEHKMRRYSPLSPEPGFIMPMELAFQYVVARPTQALRDSITEEEMLAYYEENKEVFRRPVAPLPEMPTLPGMPGGTVPFPAPAFPGMPAPAVTPTLPAMDDLPPADEPVPADTPSEAPMETTPDEPEPAETEISAIAKILTQPALFQLNGEIIGALVFPDIEGEPAADTDSQPETSTESEPAQEEPVAVETEPAAPEQEVSAMVESEAAEAPVDISILYRPFDEVKEQIQTTLARQKATEALSAIQAKMREYYVTYHEHFDAGRPIPPMPDLTGFVAEQGLELLTVPLGNVYAAIKTEFARILHERAMLMGMFQGQDDISLGQLFSGMPILFEGRDFWTMEGMVLYWITDYKDIRRPERLDEVRDIVRQRWKEVEARTLVQQKAEALAEEARAAGQSLAEVFAQRSDIPVVETASFTWRDIGEVSEVGVESGFAFFDNRVLDFPGTDFMETVYALNPEPGQLGRDIAVVFNQPQTAAYIVRLTSSSPSPEALWERFQITPVWEYLRAGQQELIATAHEAWLDEIRSKTGFRWVNRPEVRE